MRNFCYYISALIFLPVLAWGSPFYMGGATSPPVVYTGTVYRITCSPISALSNQYGTVFTQYADKYYTSGVSSVFHDFGVDSYWTIPSFLCDAQNGFRWDSDGWYLRHSSWAGEGGSLYLPVGGVTLQGATSTLLQPGTYTDGGGRTWTITLISGGGTAGMVPHGEPPDRWPGWWEYSPVTGLWAWHSYVTDSRFKPPYAGSPDGSGAWYFENSGGWAPWLVEPGYDLYNGTYENSSWRWSGYGYASGTYPLGPWPWASNAPPVPPGTPPVIIGDPWTNTPPPQLPPGSPGSTNVPPAEPPFQSPSPVLASNDTFNSQLYDLLKTGLLGDWGAVTNGAQTDNLSWTNMTAALDATNEAVYAGYLEYVAMATQALQTVEAFGLMGQHLTNAFNSIPDPDLNPMDDLSVTLYWNGAYTNFPIVIPDDVKASISVMKDIGSWFFVLLTLGGMLQLAFKSAT